MGFFNFFFDAMARSLILKELLNFLMVINFFFLFFSDNAIEEDRPAAPILEDVKTKEGLPAKRLPRQVSSRSLAAIDRLAAPRVARSVGPLKRKFL